VEKREKNWSFTGANTQKKMSADPLRPRETIRVSRGRKCVGAGSGHEGIAGRREKL